MNLRWTNRRVLWVGGALLLAGAVLAVILSKPKEPVYQGRKLTAWLEAARGPQGDIAPDASVATILRVGTNALPWLVNEARAADSWLTLIHFWLHQARPDSFSKPAIAAERAARANIGFAILGDAALPAVPDLVKLLQHRDDRRSSAGLMALLAASGADDSWAVIYRMAATGRSNSHALSRAEVFNALLKVAAGTNDTPARREALQGLGHFRDESGRSLPVLIRGRHDGAVYVRVCAIWSMGRMAREPVAVIPELIGALDDPSIEVRRSAAYALGQFYRQAKTAVPRLLQARNDPDPSVKKMANESLDKIDPETAAAIPDLPGFKP